MHQYQVSFGEAIKGVFQNYCCFTGRAPRSEYWWFYLFDKGVNIVLFGWFFYRLAFGDGFSEAEEYSSAGYSHETLRQPLRILGKGLMI